MRTSLSACSRAYVIQSCRKRQHSKYLDGEADIWSAPGLPELWITPERELVGAVGSACSRAYVIQSCRKRQHSKLGVRGGYVLECFRLAGALDRVGTGTRRSGWDGVFPSIRHPKLSQAPALQILGWRGGYLECSRLAGALDHAGAGTRGNGWEGVFPSIRHPKLSQALSFTHKYFVV